MIEVKRTEVITVTTEDGTEVKTGKPYVFIAGDKAYIGTFTGISSRGSLCFEYEGINFGFLPASIKTIKPLETVVSDIEKVMGGKK